MEYWHDLQTEKSWNILMKIKGKFNFILVGGWAVYLWTKAQKSKDIDIIVDFKTLSGLKKDYDVRKNDSLKKYEIKIDEMDIDVYVKHYSKLAIEIGGIETSEIEGFNVAKPEFLLALKQGAEADRKESEKGEKDRIDIIGLLFKCDINFKRYRNILKENKKEYYLSRLIQIINTFKQPDYFSLSPRQFKLAKNEILNKIKS